MSWARNRWARTHRAARTGHLAEFAGESAGGAARRTCGRRPRGAAVRNTAWRGPRLYLALTVSGRPREPCCGDIAARLRVRPRPGVPTDHGVDRGTADASRVDPGGLVSDHEGWGDESFARRTTSGRRRRASWIQRTELDPARLSASRMGRSARPPRVTTGRSWSPRTPSRLHSPAETDVIESCRVFDLPAHPSSRSDDEPDLDE